MRSARLLLPWPPSVAGLYVITDRVSGKFYIGSSVNVRRRAMQHQYRLEKLTHANPILQAIWNSGADRLRIELLRAMPSASREQLIEAEQLELTAAGVGSNRQCMNVLPIAGSPKGQPRSEETKRKIGAAVRGKSPSLEARAKMRAAKIGRPLTLAHRAKIGAAGRGRPGPRHSSEMLARWRRYSADQVHSLRSMVAEGMPVFTAAKRLGIVRATARRIVAGESYRESHHP